MVEDSFVSITIYDMMGRNIRALMNVNQTAGYHSIQWDAKNDMGEGVSAGMYIYIIQVGEFQATKKMVLLKQRPQNVNLKSPVISMGFLIGLFQYIDSLNQNGREKSKIAYMELFNSFIGISKLVRRVLFLLCSNWIYVSNQVLKDFLFKYFVGMRINVNS